MPQSTAAIADHEGSEDQGSVNERRRRHHHADDRTSRFRKQRLGGGTSSGPVETFLRLDACSTKIFNVLIYHVVRSAGDARRIWLESYILKFQFNFIRIQIAPLTTDDKVEAMRISVHGYLAKDDLIFITGLDVLDVETVIDFRSCYRRRGFRCTYIITYRYAFIRFFLLSFFLILPTRVLFVRAANNT